MDSKQEPLAVIGYSYRAPGVGRSNLWELLEQAKSAWSPVPAERFDAKAYYHPSSERAGCVTSHGGHFLPGDVFAFDAPFFNFRSDEAKYVDPKVRMLLECTWETMESAGVRPLDLARSRIGVFAATGASDYVGQLMDDMPTASSFTALGTAPCMTSNRISHFFDLVGPSVSLEAACATGGYALHMACQSVRSGECSAALVGACILNLGPENFSTLDTVGTLSVDGKSYSWDARANGFGRGEGATCLLIKPLAEAIKAGDPIRAVIKNTTASHCGRTPGISMPSQQAHESLFRDLHEQVGLDPRDTTYVEGHGTGTPVGDPVDASAIAAVFGRDRSPSLPVYLGSIKANIGHLEEASGLLSVVKSIMMIERERLLPTAFFETLNPAIKSGEKLCVLKESLAWPPGTLKRVAIGNYGFGGANAAVLLEEAPSDSTRDGDLAQEVNGSVNESPKEQGQKLFVFSAKSSHSLDAYLTTFQQYALDLPQESTKDLCFTLGQRRAHLPYRAAFTADSTSSLSEVIAASLASTAGKLSKSGDLDITFVFTGQGAQYFRMALGLSHYPVFATAIEEADKFLESLGSSWSLQEELSKSESDSRIDEPAISQPTCTAVQLALVQLLRAFGITPSKVMGHSSGEIAAAFAAGMISFKSALAIAFLRGQAATKVLEDTDISGSMLAIGIGAEGARELFPEDDEGYATIAAYNSANSVTISGDDAAIEAIQKKAEDRGLFARKLRTGIAYHSRHMEKVAEDYASMIEDYFPSDSPVVSPDEDPVFVSSVTGLREPKEIVADSSYWVRNMLQPVLFTEALEELLSMDEDSEQSLRSSMLVEIGPHAALQNPIRDTLKRLAPPQVMYAPSLVRKTDDVESILDLTARLFKSGLDVDFGVVNQISASSARVLVDLPPYEWNKSTSFRHQSLLTRKKLHPDFPYNTLLGWKNSSDGHLDHSFRQVFTLDDMPWLRDHIVGGDVIFPMAGYLCMAAEAIRLISRSPPTSLLLRDIQVKTALTILEEEQVQLTTRIRPSGSTISEERSFEIISLSASDDWVVHCQGTIKPEYSSVESALTAQIEAVIADQAELEECNVEEEYAAMKRSGISWGPLFQGMTSLRAKKGATVHTVGLRPTDHERFFTDKSPVTVDAPILDSFNHSVGLVQGREGAKSNITVPTFINRARISNRITSDNFTIGTIMPSQDSKSGNCTLNVCAFAAGEDGSLQEPVLEVEGLQLRCISKAEHSSADGPVPRSYMWTKIPSLDLADDADLVKMLPPIPADEAEMQEDIRVRDVGIYYTAQALEAVKDKDMSHLPPHFSKWFAWAHHMVDKWPLDMEQVKATIPEVSQGSSQGQINCMVGEELVRILNGEVEPLEVILRDGLLTRYYEEHQPTVRGAEGIARYVRILAGMKPDLAVLEIGGGTGSTAPATLEALESQALVDAPWHYTFTDISAGFFPNAKEKLRQFGTERVTYQKLDISQDPVQQGFASASYDLIIAGLVLHATPNIEETLQNARSLLKPGGRLIMLEFVDPDGALLPFTLLPGWWNAEDQYRSPLGPELTADSWNMALQEAGFSGIDHSFSVSDNPITKSPVMSVMCCSRVDTDPSSESVGEACKVTIVGDLDLDTSDFVTSISDEVKASCCSVVSDVTTLHDFAASDEQYCIYIDQADNSLLKDLSETSFEALKSTLLNTGGLLWVIPEGASPDAHLITGMLRAMRLEDTSKNFLLLTEVPQNATGARTVVRVAKQLLSGTIAADDEQEFIWSDNLIMLPRLKENLVAKEKFELEAGSLVRKERSLWRDDDTTGLELNVENVGDPSTIYFRELKISDQDLGDDELLVRVEAASLNVRDLQVINGSLPWTTPGLEGVGTVLHTGTSVAELEEGDRVMFLTEEGAMATHIRLLTHNICKLPAEMTNTDIAGFPLAYATAHIALSHTAQVTQEDTVLIHGAADTVGRMCIAVAQSLGATVFASARTADERSDICTNFGIPSSNVFSCDASDVREGILKATQGQGVHVLINNTSNDELMQQSADVVANFGRWVNLRTADQQRYNGTRVNHALMARNVTLSKMDMHQFIKHRPQLVAESLREGVKVLQSDVGETLLHGQTTLPISQLTAGMQKLQSDTDHKILLTMGQDESVIGEAQSSMQKSGPLLSSDATYLISGGTGGIGRSLAVWMFEHGAGNVVLLGRSGASRPEVAELLSTYSGLRAIECDVSDRDALAKALEDIQDLPPVRGVVHGALYIRDSLLVNHTYEDWTRITSPKVQGAWSLDALLPDLDFFISLASMNSVIGLVGVTIYSGTSSFLEAFTKHRLHQGQPATTIHLPVVEGTGYVEERNMTEEMRKTHGISLKMSHIETLVQGAIIGSSSGLSPDGIAISGVLWPMNRGMRWEHWPHVRALTTGLLAGRDSADEHDKSRGGSKGAVGESSADLLEGLIAKVAEMTMMEIEEIPAEMPLGQLGLDSLVAVELRNWIKREGKVELPLTKIVGAKNLKALAEHVASC